MNINKMNNIAFETLENIAIIIWVAVLFKFNIFYIASAVGWLIGKAILFIY